MTNNTKGGPLAAGCPHGEDDCSPAYLCLGCCHDLEAGVYLENEATR